MGGTVALLPGRRQYRSPAVNSYPDLVGGQAVQVVVSLGTDHHQFNRLVDWIDEWLATQINPPTCLVQYGGSKPPSVAAGIPRMPRGDLLQLYRLASVVVVQGGPGSILDAREVGQIPLAIPRRPELHEVVDRHQIAFTQTMAEHGEAIAIETSLDLGRELSLAMADPASMRTEPRHSDPASAARKLELALSQLGRVDTGPIALRRIRQVITRH